jgi:CDP-paratose synthetase
MKNILLTGSTGFLGSHLLKKLVANSYSVTCLKRQSSDLWRVKKLTQEVDWADIESTDFHDVIFEKKIDYIIHCATDYGRKQVNPIETIEANLMLPLRLLHASKKTNVSAFINTDTILDKRINHYSLSKSQFVDWLRYYSSDFTVINLAIEHFYGAHDDVSKFASFIISELLDNKAKELDLTKGLQERDFIHIDDVTEAFLILIGRISTLEQDFYHFEVGSNELISIKDFVTLVKKLCNNTKTKLNFGALPYRKNEVMCTNADTSFLKSLGWETQFTLEEGLKEAIHEERTTKIFKN